MIAMRTPSTLDLEQILIQIDIVHINELQIYVRHKRYVILDRINSTSDI